MGDVVLIGSCSGKFWAMDRHTGEGLWVYDITLDGEQYEFHGNPLVVDSLVVVCTDGRGVGHLYAFDLEWGDVRWMIPDERGFATDIISHDGRGYAVSLFDQLVCFDPQSSDVLWRFSPPDTAGVRRWSATPAASDGRIFFGARSGSVYALSADSGEVIWERDLESQLSTSVLAHDSDIVVGTEDGHLYRLARSDGSTRHTLDLGMKPMWKLVGLDDRIVMLADRSSTVVCVDDSLTTVLWRFKGGKSWGTYRPHSWRDLIVLGNFDEKVYAIDPRDGSVRWSRGLDDAIRGIGHADGILYLGTLDGTVYAWRPPAFEKKH